MTTTIRQQRERQKKLIILLVVLLVAMGVALYFGLGLGAGPPSTPTSSVGGPLTSSVDRSQVTSVSFDLAVLQKEAFAGLQMFGDLPIVLGELGRLNPFIAPTTGLGQ